MSATPSLARGAAAITLATAISRATGFLRVVVVAAAMGTTFLANVYQTANTAPNLVFELVAAGVLTSVFVPTFVDHIVRGSREEGWEAGNALTSVALVALAVLAGLLALAAPAVMRLLTLGVDDPELRAQEIALGSDFLRLFAPQIVFYGLSMVMAGALHAHRRFGPASVAPIFNNVVVIAVYLAYAALRGDEPPSVSGITTTQKLVLGAGTTLGVVAMTSSLIPHLRRLGWRFRFRFDLAHPAVRRGARLGAWALGYAGGYQAGLIVVLLLANRVEGGVAAYQWAYTFFYLPHALFGIPIFSVLFTAMAEHVAREEEAGFVSRLADGLRVLVFLLLPVTAFLYAAAYPLAHLTLRYGVMSGTGADQVAAVLRAFAVGLPAYSVFLVFTRAFYALRDARVPALINALSVAIAGASGAALFFVLSDGAGSVPGLALGHSIGFVAGVLVIGALFRKRFGSLGGRELTVSVARSAFAALVTLAAMVAIHALLGTDVSTRAGAVTGVVTLAVGGASVYLAASWLTRSPELARAGALLRGVVKR